MKIFEVEKDKHGTVLGYSIFGITVMSRRKFHIWDTIYMDTLLENISLTNKCEKLERRATPIIVNGLDPLKRKLDEYEPDEDECYLYNSIFDMMDEVRKEIMRY